MIVAGMVKTPAEKSLVGIYIGRVHWSIGSWMVPLRTCRVDAAVGGNPREKRHG